MKEGRKSFGGDLHGCSNDDPFADFGIVATSHKIPKGCGHGAIDPGRTPQADPTRRGFERNVRPAWTSRVLKPKRRPPNEGNPAARRLADLRRRRLPGRPPGADPRRCGRAVSHGLQTGLSVAAGLLGIFSAVGYWRAKVSEFQISGGALFLRTGPFSGLYADHIGS